MSSATTSPHNVSSSQSHRTRLLSVQDTSVPSLRRLKISAASSVWAPRMLISALGLATLLLILLPTSLAVGDYTLSWEQIAEVLKGGGESLERTVVLDWRGPRTAAGLLAGAALGAAGAFAQSTIRNPLASPDLLGITGGASAAAVTVIVLGAPTTGVKGTLVLPLTALLGGLLVALLLWGLSSLRGSGLLRLLLSGVLLTALCGAYVNWLLVNADLWDAANAQTWLNGSLEAASWERTAPVFLALLISVPISGWSAPRLTRMHLGSDTASGLGVNIKRTQIVVLFAAVLLASTAAAAVGPLGFVALLAPHVARILTGAHQPPIAAATLSGAAIVLGSDIAVRTFIPSDPPVGVVTSALGGALLLYLLPRSSQRNTA